LIPTSSAVAIWLASFPRGRRSVAEGTGIPRSLALRERYAFTPTTRSNVKSSPVATPRVIERRSSRRCFASKCRNASSSSAESPEGAASGPLTGGGTVRGRCVKSAPQRSQMRSVGHALRKRGGNQNRRPTCGQRRLGDASPAGANLSKRSLALPPLHSWSIIETAS
jgi:hypothetical protein